jgi:serine/threonine protein kinase
MMTLTTLDVIWVRKCPSLDHKEFHVIFSILETERLLIDPEHVKISEDDKLGSGKSHVYKGTFKKDQEIFDVAVKKIALKSFGSVKYNIKWSELNNLRKAKHENVIKFYGHFPGTDFHNLVLELAECTLEQFLTKKKKNYNSLKSLLDRKQILLDATRGLSYIHKKEIIHFDLKPENIFIILQNGKAKAVLGDFGSSKENSKISKITSIAQDQLGTQVEKSYHW